MKNAEKNTATSNAGEHRINPLSRRPRGQRPARADEEPTLERLTGYARQFGISRAQLITAAYHYCGVSDLERLTAPQVGRLIERMTARYGDPANALRSERKAQARRNGQQADRRAEQLRRAA